MTFEAFSAHLTQIICPFRVSPSPPLFRLYFSSEICNPYSKELLTWWTFVVLVNAAIQVIRLVKTCALTAANGVCSEQGVQVQSFFPLCVQRGSTWGRGGRAGQLDSSFPTSLWAIPEGLSWSFFVGKVGVIESMEIFCPANGNCHWKLFPELNTTPGNISSAQTTNKSLHMHLKKDARLIWAGHRKLWLQEVLKPSLMVVGSLINQPLGTKLFASSVGAVSIPFNRKVRGRGKVEVDHITLHYIYQISSTNIFAEKIKIFLLKSKSTFK